MAFRRSSVRSRSAPPNASCARFSVSRSVSAFAPHSLRSLGDSERSRSSCSEAMGVSSVSRSVSAFAPHSLRSLGDSERSRSSCSEAMGVSSVIRSVSAFAPHSLRSLGDSERIPFLLQRGDGCGFGEPIGLGVRAALPSVARRLGTIPIGFTNRVDECAEEDGGRVPAVSEVRVQTGPGRAT